MQVLFDFPGHGPGLRTVAKSVIFASMSNCMEAYALASQVVELIRSILVFWKDKYSKIDAQGHWLILGWGVGASIAVCDRALNNLDTWEFTILGVPYRESYNCGILGVYIRVHPKP